MLQVGDIVKIVKPKGAWADSKKKLVGTVSVIVMASRGAPIIYRIKDLDSVYDDKFPAGYQWEEDELCFEGVSHIPKFNFLNFVECDMYKGEIFSIKSMRLYKGKCLYDIESQDSRIYIRDADENTLSKTIWRKESKGRTEEINPLTIQNTLCEENQSMETTKVKKSKKKVATLLNLKKELWVQTEQEVKKNTFTVKAIYTDGKTTVVKWGDGTETKVRRMEGTEYSAYDAFCDALAKRVYGTSSFVRKIADQMTTVSKQKDKKPTEEEVASSNEAPIDTSCESLVGEEPFVSPEAAQTAGEKMPDFPEIDIEALAKDIGEGIVKAAGLVESKAKEVFKFIAKELEKFGEDSDKE